jgi:hypothetical protein
MDILQGALRIGTDLGAAAHKVTQANTLHDYWRAYFDAPRSSPLELIPDFAGRTLGGAAIGGGGAAMAAMLRNALRSSDDTEHTSVTGAGLLGAGLGGVTGLGLSAYNFPRAAISLQESKMPKEVLPSQGLTFGDNLPLWREALSEAPEEKGAAEAIVKRRFGW